VAVGVNISVLQVVGFQNSGKTTLLEKLVRAALRYNLRVGTIKHHGHDGRPSEADVGKDSYRHRKAGADITAVVGEDMLQLHAIQSAWKLEQIIELYKWLGMEAVFVEGYKNANYPKVVMVRHNDDIELLTSVTNVVAVISWIPLRTTYKTYHIHEDEKYIYDLLSIVREKDGESII